MPRFYFPFRPEILLLTLTIASLVGCERRKPQEVVKPPAAVVQTLHTLFPQVDSARWKKEDGGFYEGHFTHEGVPHKLRVNPDGRWRETEQDVARTALPVPVQDTLQRLLETPPRTARVRRTSIVTFADGRTEYEVQVRLDGDWFKRYYDAKGHLLREEKAKHG